MTLPLLGHITPTWDMTEINQLRDNMEWANLRSSQTSISSYADAGHNLENIFVHVYFEPKPMPAGTDLVMQEFSQLNNLHVAVNCLSPGAYLPWHEDGYDRFLQVTGVSDRNKIYRAIVMAEDGVPGQYLHVGNTIHHMWKAGDWFAWYGLTSHATYNFSCKKRFAFQITGTILDE